MSNKTKAILAIIGSALCAACNFVLIKYLGKTLSPLSMSYLRIGIGIIFLIVLFSKRISFKKLLQASRKQLLLFFITGALGWGIAIYFSAIALTKTLVVNVTFIESCAPIIVYAYSLVLLKEKLQSLRVLLSLISIYGALVIATNSFLPTLNQFKIGEVFALMYVALICISYVVRKMLQKAFNTIEITFVFMLFAFVALICLALVTHDSLQLHMFSPAVTVSTVLTGIFICLSVTGTNYALKYISPVLTSQLMLTKIIFAFILSFLAFKELPYFTSFIGGILIVSSVSLSGKYFS